MGNVARLPLPGTGNVCDGWMWNGTNWVWVGQPCPPQPCPPICPPPPSGCAPPSCSDILAKVQSCWDQSQDLEALLTKIITDIFEQNPGLIPPPPPTAGTGPIIGVTDGSDAAPGEVGEWMFSAVNGTLAQNAGLATYQALTLTPGDWDCWGYLDIGLPPGSTQFYQQMYYRLSQNGTGFAYGDVGGVFPGGSGFGGGVYPTNVGRVSVAAPTLIVATVEVFGFTGAEADITLNTFARRMR